MPLQATSGAASYDAFGGGVPVVPNYIEDVFSTWLYTGTSATQTITNGIDLAGKGGLVWAKDRTAANSHQLYDTVRGVQKRLITDQTAAQGTETSGITAFNSNGWTMGAQYEINGSGSNYVSWTFREQPKFFDVVTYTGDGTAGRQISHNLGSAPGCIIVKCTSATTNWGVYHRSLTQSGGYSYGVFLNTTAVSNAFNLFADSTQQTNTYFTLGDTSNISVINDSGQTYVAYLFAHNAGGFGLTGTDNVISCGSYTGVGSTQQDITLGYEPQWLMIKRTDTTNQWVMVDNMRGFFRTADNALCANTADAEAATVSVSGAMQPTATGFHLYNGNSAVNASGGTYIYIAIRRGPMKVPTDATKVFSPFTTAGSTGTAVTTNFPVDFQLYKYRAGIDYWFDVDRLRGVNSTTTGNSTPWLDTTSTAAETTATNVSRNWGNTGFEVPGIVGGASNVFYSFQRAPGFFDEVCYTGTGTYGATNHNLGVTPELVIYKSRSNAVNWGVIKPVSSIAYYDGILNSTSAFTYYSNDPSIAGLYTSTQFAKYQDTSGYTYVAYLFATCPGVSKVGSFTGTGATQTINCGFTTGARFVLVKRTDSTGDWYVWDTARGMVSGTDPSLLLNSDVAEVNANSVYTATTGFEIVSTASGINASGGTYIFLAIA